MSKIQLLETLYNSDLDRINSSRRIFTIVLSIFF